MPSAKWSDVRAARPETAKGIAAYADESRIADYRKLVHAVRTAAGLTQAQLADRMGTTQSAIARLESGGAKPTLHTLEKLAVSVGLELFVSIGPINAKD
jgi:ribosome-binding protein aMBF1 (putative translation factor)